MINNEQRKAFSQWLRATVYRTMGLNVPMMANPRSNDASSIYHVEILPGTIKELIDEIDPIILGNDTVRTVRCIARLEEMWNEQKRRQELDTKRKSIAGALKHEYQARGLRLAITLLREQLK